MSPQLQTILDNIRNNSQLSDAEKESLIKSVKEADKAQSMVLFRLERTERDKNTLSIMLEESIQDLEQKSKAIEVQNRELEVENALEKVRTIALSMKEPSDMLDVCHIIAGQLGALKVKEIRNVQTAIFYETKGTYVNYEYYVKHDKLLVTEVDYKNHEIQEKFANQMLAGAEELFSIHIAGKELQDWYAYQKTTNQFADTYLEKASSLNYYWFSLGPVALGISTYEPLKENEIDLFKRFRNVFELAYRRFIDIELAVAQAKEARIETALERVRAVAMAMKTSDDLLSICEVLYKELSNLGFSGLRNALIDTFGEGKDYFDDYDYADATGGSITYVPYNSNPIVEAFVKKVRSSPGSFSELVVDEIELNSWKEYRKRNGQPADPSLDKCSSLYYYMYSIGISSIGISAFTPLAKDKVEVLERFANVFKLAYQRYTDISLAAAQAREAQVQLALERVRARTMAMQKSEELQDATLVLFQQFKELRESTTQVSICIFDDEVKMGEMYLTLNGEKIDRSFQMELDKEIFVMKKAKEAFLNKQGAFSYSLEGKELQKYNQWRNCFVERNVYDESDAAHKQSWHVNAVFFSKGMIGLSSEMPASEETVTLVGRFAKVFDGTYTRFQDLQKAEAQAREAKIEMALEKVRSRTMAMQHSDELSATAAVLFQQFNELGESPDQITISILNEAERVFEMRVTVQGVLNNSLYKVSIDEPNLMLKLYTAWVAQKKSVMVHLTGKTLSDWVHFRTKLGGQPVNKNELTGDRYINAANFSKGMITLSTLEKKPEETIKLLERFAAVFDGTYTRFLDLQKAEAQARESKIETALEKVRSRTLAMQRSDELAETSVVLFRQLIGLGIEPNRLYIAIIETPLGDTDFWITDEDGSKVSSGFHVNLNQNKTFKEMFDGWNNKQLSLSIDMNGEELKTYFKQLQQLNVPFKGGDNQERRVQTIAYFSKGFIGLASPEPQPPETTLLLERFASVFNLTFTRFNDLKVSEAHAVQAEEDLVKLQTEKKRAEDALAELQSTQKQLIQSEKMASLGELTAGIAHEIQNPLNFVNNFSEVSKELLDEMKTELDSGNIADAKEIMTDVIQNLEKINHHGKRADAIVKGMLQHSRSSSGVKEPNDINALCDEYLRLSYHGLRAKDKSFNATFKTDFDHSIRQINIIPQDIGRVVLNLLTNAFYVVDEKKKSGIENYEPTVSVVTKNVGDKVEIKVSDNGNGIPKKVLDKIFQPFFTTKPTGQGTGLGLSLSYDIVTKGHGGELKVETREGEGTVFIISLPA